MLLTYGNLQPTTPPPMTLFTCTVCVKQADQGFDPSEFVEGNNFVKKFDNNIMEGSRDEGEC
jgi:hypothetical protein